LGLVKWCLTERKRMPRYRIGQDLSFRTFKKCRVEAVDDRPQVLRLTLHNQREPSTKGGITEDWWVR
jgi:hypothetical protein